MNDLERKLKAIPTATPDDSHDRRMNRLFLESERRRAWFSRPIPLWLAGAAFTVVFVAVLLLRGGQDTPAIHPAQTAHTVYFIPATPEFRRALENGGMRRTPPSDSGFYVIEVAPFDESVVTQAKEAT